MICCEGEDKNLHRPGRNSEVYEMNGLAQGMKACTAPTKNLRRPADVVMQSLDRLSVVRDSKTYHRLQCA